jgi:hypothetical protein
VVNSSGSGVLTMAQANIKQQVLAGSGGSQHLPVNSPCRGRRTCTAARKTSTHAGSGV